MACPSHVRNAGGSARSPQNSPRRLGNVTLLPDGPDLTALAALGVAGVRRAVVPAVAREAVTRFPDDPAGCEAGVSPARRADGSG